MLSVERFLENADPEDEAPSPVPDYGQHLAFLQTSIDHWSEYEDKYMQNKEYKSQALTKERERIWPD